MRNSSTEGIRVLHVDDDQDFADLVGLYLERENEDIEIVTESSAKDGLERLEREEIDCIVSDYNMPGMDGIEFLERVREDWPDRPFILYTGRGSEEIASEAISAGVTDYLQKEQGTDQYKVLANRIENAVAQHRAEQEVEATTKWYSTILEHSSDYVMIIDEMGDVAYVSPAIERVLGYRPDDIVGDNSFDFVHPDDAEAAARTMAEVIEDPKTESTAEFRARHADGSWRWLETRGRNLLDDPIIEGVMVNVRDITERKEREQTLERQKDRLQDLSSFISHDVQNRLTVVDGRLELAREEVESEHLDVAATEVDRIDEMIEGIMELARGGADDAERESVELASVAEDCWRTVTPEDADLVAESNATLDANDERFRSLLENLFLNAVEHNDEDVTIRTGPLESDDGFYVEDDGEGIPEDEREQVFESGYTTSDAGTGFGLAIVKEVAETHGWSITVTESDDGGARFEFTGVESVSACSAA
jgi:PAS domain S-box-containing protein